MEVAIAIVLIVLGVAGFYGFIRLQKSVQRGLQNHGRVAETPTFDDIEVAEGPLGPDEIVYLYAHEFARPRLAGTPTLPRDRVSAPMAGTEVDAEDLTSRLLYATICELYREKYLEIRLVERDPTYLPPFPQKKWELQLRRAQRFPPGPLCDTLSVGFDLTRRRLQAKQQRIEEDKLWVGLDELIERGLKAVRQELSFWERSGVHGDLRNYVSSSLVARGYLVAPQGDTWFDKVRTRKLLSNKAAIETVADQARSLKHRLETFCKMHGSSEAQVDAPNAKLHDNVAPDLAEGGHPLEELPIDDCLRLSIYEALLSIKQLEPSGEPGV
jgi:hypothetical protein